MKQYKDELLASCLVFVLSLPSDIIMLDIKAYIPALQVSQYGEWTPQSFFFFCVFF